MVAAAAAVAASPPGGTLLVTTHPLPECLPSEWSRATTQALRELADRQEQFTPFEMSDAASKWVQGEAMNAAVSLLCDAANSKDGCATPKRFGTLGSYFATPGASEKELLMPSARATLRRMTERCPAWRFLLFPVHIVNHWTLVFFDRQKNAAWELDSLYTGKLTRPAQLAVEYIRRHVAGASDCSFATADVPQQPNYVDCGVYVMMFARHLCQVGETFTGRVRRGDIGEVGQACRSSIARLLRRALELYAS